MKGMAEDKGEVEVEEKELEVKESSGVAKNKRKGIISRIWNGIFRLHRSDDFEKKLQYITKEEANVLKRMNKRSLNWRVRTRQLVYVSVVLEVVAVVYAIITTRSMDLDWKMRAIRVLPMFVLPAFSSAVYSVFVSVTRMRDRKDQKTLEWLRAERQAKIDELKERTNYYITQQLIQRYDPDPAAKAAAATVLASKLGADSGLKVYVGDENAHDVVTGKSKDVEHVQAGGLRNRKQVHAKSSSGGSTPVHHPDREMAHSVQSEDPTTHGHEQLVVEHYHSETSTTNDGGWLARLAALLVGEDPAQSYALICGNCHRHNGLARKEDFPYVTYYCPHCMALNQPKQLAERVSGSNSPHLSTLGSGGNIEVINEAGGSPSNSVLTSNSPVKAGESEVEDTSETVTLADSGS